MSVQRATGHSRQRDCPACGAPSVTLPRFVTRRRRRRACTNCGERLVIVYSSPSYHLLAFVVAALMEAAMLAVLVLFLFQQWPWAAAVVVAVTVVNLLASSFLNSRAAIVRDDLDEVSRQEIFGRWYPK